MNHVLTLSPDRHLRVPPGAVVRTGYVPIDQVRMACRAGMAVGHVEASYRTLIQAAPGQPWPPPVGQWEGERFVVQDGRHTYVAALMIGFETLFVAWVEGGET